MPNAIDVAGQRFGKLVAIEVVETGRRRKWRCKCDCGQYASCSTDNLRNGNSRSCRSCCMDGNQNRKAHGGRPQGKKSPTYNSWQSMKRRCDNEFRDNAKHYALAGVKYDPRWVKFENFLMDMGERPPGFTLDRVDNALGYSKENCRWATPTQQTRNRRTALQFEWEGERKPIAEWARLYGLSYAAAFSRIRRHNSLRLPHGDD